MKIIAKKIVINSIILSIIILTSIALSTSADAKKKSSSRFMNITVHFNEKCNSKTFDFKKCLGKNDKLTKKVKKEIINNITSTSNIIKGKFVTATKLKMWAGYAKDTNIYEDTETYSIRTKNNNQVILKCNITYDRKSIILSDEERNALDTIVANGKEFIKANTRKNNQYTDEYNRVAALQEYIRTLNMQYNFDSNNIPKHGEVENPWQSILNGTYKGVCGESALRARIIAVALGFNAVVISSNKMNHAWCVVECRDANGIYWQGINASSYAVTLEDILDFDNSNYNPYDMNVPDNFDIVEYTPVF